jgi:hypothetical protein
MAAATTQRPFDPFTSPSSLTSPEVSITSTPKASSTHKPRDIETTLNYFKANEDGSPPAPTYVARPETYNRPIEPHRATVHDIRGRESEFTLDKTGFEIVKHQSAEKDFLDEEKIKQVYYKEVEDILKKEAGATKVFIFDHTIRRASGDIRGAPLRGPVQRVHIDQSYRAAPLRVTHHLPDEADTLLKSRYRIINVWRPIRRILKDPLAVADANSVPDSDLVPIGLIYPDREGETYSVRHGEGHKWYYLDGQDTDEVLLIKCFDSIVDGRARRVPHTAVVDEEREGELPRESIEVRALVFG